MVKIITADHYLDLEHPAINSMTDDELFSFCSQNRDVRIERDENNQILIMAPTGLGISSKNFTICELLFYGIVNQIQERHLTRMLVSFYLILLC